jgi:uncharacterized repeat protein (TIGR03803 family)
MKKLLALLLMTPAAVLAQSATVPRLTTLHSFQDSTGTLPVGALVEGEDGVFYGVTASGGGLDGGTVYKVTSAGLHIVLYRFGRAPNNQTGERPQSGLVRGADGTYYGTTALGGPGQNSHGVVYRITPDGVLTVIHAFNEADGYSPGEIMMASDGFLYGTTQSGGTEGGGTIYRLSADGEYTELHSFAIDDAEGGFAFSPPGVVASSHSFNGAAGSEEPDTTLVAGRDGRLYGTASGTSNSGTVFQVAFAPETPANLTASATSTSGTADGEVRLSWDAVRDANTYDVYRGTASGSLTLMSGGSGLTVTNILVTGLTPGVRYYFAVVAANETGASARSAEASAIPAGLAVPIGGGTQPDERGGGGSFDFLMLALLVSLAALRVVFSRP